LLQKLFNDILIDVLGLKEENAGDSDKVDGLMDLIISIRGEARNKKDFATSDKIRDELAKLSIKIKDEKSGVSWVKE